MCFLIFFFFELKMVGLKGEATSSVESNIWMVYNWTRIQPVLPDSCMQALGGNGSLFPVKSKS